MYRERERQTEKYVYTMFVYVLKMQSIVEKKKHTLTNVLTAMMAISG